MVKTFHGVNRHLHEVKFSSTKPEVEVNKHVHEIGVLHEKIRCDMNMPFSLVHVFM